jgi:hypothetical protein
MWFYPLLVVLVILGVVGGTQAQAGAATDATTAKAEPLPHHRRRPSGRAATSPEALLDSRRHQQ